MAVYAVNPEYSTDIGGHNIGYFWSIKTSDGGYVSWVLKITHSTNTDERWMTSSAAMYYTQHSKVVVALQTSHKHTDGGVGLQTTNGTEYDSKMRIIDFSILPLSMKAI